MLTVVQLGTTAYSSNGTPYAGFSGTTKSWGSSRFFGLKLQLEDEQYSTIEFTVIGCGPAMPFNPGQSVQVYFCADDGTSPVLTFAGRVITPQMQPSEQGPAWGYTGKDLKWIGDRVTLLSSAGLAVASYNLAVTDPLYLFSQSGLTVGQIVTDVLQSATNAANLAAYGVGNYTLSMGVYTLPSQTVSDLAALTIVPAEPVQLQGESILARLQSFIAHWMNQFTMWVQPDGTIRVMSIFGRTAYTLTQPWGGAVGDPVDQLQYKPDLDGCYAAVQIIGQNIQWTTLSALDGTLTRATTAPELAAWTSASFNSPSNSDNKDNANDTGTLSGVTTTSCVVTSDNPLVHWDVNFWNANGGVLQLINLAVSGIDITVTVQVTSSTAMTPGGSATLTWSSSVALTSTAFTRYRLYAMNTAESLVDREFYVTEPSTGATGLATYVGAHLYPYSPFSYAWANQGKGAASVANINFPAAIVLWSQNGQYPWFSSSVPVTVDPTTGTIVLSEPAVFISAGFANQTPALASGYPKTFYQGKWYDVQVAVPYNAGGISTRYPSSGFSGTANATYGLTDVKTIALANFVYAGDTPALNELAQQHLLTVQDTVTEGSIRLHFDYWTSTFNPFALGYALNIVTPGAASPIDGLNLPVRSVTMDWPDSGADIHLVTFQFSNRHRAFEADSLYIHPSFSPTGWGAQDGETIFGQTNMAAGGNGFLEPSMGGIDSGFQAAGAAGFQGLENGWKDQTSAALGPGADSGLSDAQITQMAGGPVGPGAAPKDPGLGGLSGRQGAEQNRDRANKQRRADADADRSARVADRKARDSHVGPPKDLAGPAPEEGVDRFDRNIREADQGIPGSKDIAEAGEVGGSP